MTRVSPLEKAISYLIATTCSLTPTSVSIKPRMFSQWNNLCQ